MSPMLQSEIGGKIVILFLEQVLKIKRFNLCMSNQKTEGGHRDENQLLHLLPKINIFSGHDRFYTGEDVSDEEYEENFYDNNQVVKVENVFHQ